MNSQTEFNMKSDQPHNQFNRAYQRKILCLNSDRL